MSTLSALSTPSAPSARSARSARSALILFAHGSRDPEWVRPFERLRASVALEAPHLSVELAYLESSAPDLDHCVRTLAASGVTAIRVLPLFLAMGRHLRTDLPALAARIKDDHPGLAIDFLPALGEAPEFVAALGAIAGRVAREGTGPQTGGEPSG